MNFAPHEPVAVGRIIGFAAWSSLSPRHFQFGSPHSKTSSLCSTTPELFTHFCNTCPLFSTLYGLFCQKHRGGISCRFAFCIPGPPARQLTGFLCVGIQGDQLGRKTNEVSTTRQRRPST